MSVPKPRSISKKRSSGGKKWAVVRPVSWQPTLKPRRSRPRICLARSSM
ncbi:hypothetical protein LP420_26295 [Massilia sp. B-10]|nr:hypothetical protein LP420_26295 [Massilia sp. B-10]